MKKAKKYDELRRRVIEIFNGERKVPSDPFQVLKELFPGIEKSAKEIKIAEDIKELISKYGGDTVIKSDTQEMLNWVDNHIKKKIDVEKTPCILPNSIAQMPLIPQPSFSPSLPSMPYSENCQNPSDETFEDEIDIRIAKGIFKVGDYVVFKENGKTFSNGKCYSLISNIDDEGRIWFDEESYWVTKDDIRHWNFGDAKDGDILTCNVRLKDGTILSPTKNSLSSNDASNDFICIFRQHDIPTWDFNAHCYLSETGDLHLNGYHLTNPGLHPANDEQCDFLLRTLRLNNYLWDDINKKIIKEDPPLSHFASYC